MHQQNQNRQGGGHRPPPGFDQRRSRALFQRTMSQRILTMASAAVRRRRRRWAGSLALAAVALFLIWDCALARPAPSSRSNFGSGGGPPPLERNQLVVGAYIEALDSLELDNNSFEAQLSLWTRWKGAEDENPSDSLEILNDIYNGDLYQFELKASRRVDDTTWNLYSVHSRFIHRWKLSSYPFDSHILRIRLGFSDPFRRDVALVADKNNSGVSPELYLYGWHLIDQGISTGLTSSLSTLGDPDLASDSTPEARTVTASLKLIRKSRLHLVPDFLGYFLAIGLCVLALLISRSRDDLILAAVVSAAGNYVFLAGILPVGAMAGFIGNLQLVILLGILFVVGADEIIDHHLGQVAPGWAQFLRSAVLPSYLLLTMAAIYLLIPSGVVEAS